MSGPGLAVQLCQEHGNRTPADLREILPNRGERRPVMRGIRHIVEPDDTDVTGHIKSRIAKRVDEAERHLVICGEDRSEVAISRELASGPIPEVGRPVAVSRRFGRNSICGLPITSVT